MRAPRAPVTLPHPRIRVCSAAESVALDREAIAAGTPGRALMERAGAAAAAEICRRFPESLTRGVLVLAGPGNNGGDGWVVARALASSGCAVQVWESEAARSVDAAAERALALAAGIIPGTVPRYQGEGIVVDALLGTGASGALRGGVAEGVLTVLAAQRRGAVVVALDVPTGVDATDGSVADEAIAVQAQLTLTFGNLKRGHLVSRGRCGTVAVLDIGLPAPDPDACTPMLVSEAAAGALMPAVAADAHKGTKRHVAIVGGAEGMAGAVILAARGALRAGAGLVRVVAHPASLDAVRTAVPQALTSSWDTADATASALAQELATWSDVLAIGPGLGASAGTRAFVEELLASGECPVVLDADALNVFAGDSAGLRQALRGRPAVLTPHPAEMMRLSGAASVQEVLAARFEIGGRLARDTGTVVLLKGVPTIISAPDGRSRVSATGTSALATGGSGDVLTGMAATLVAQMDDVLHAASLAAWAHGRAAEVATLRAGTTRGVSLDEVLAAVANTAWAAQAPPICYPVLCELP